MRQLIKRQRFNIADGAAQTFKTAMSVTALLLFIFTIPLTAQETTTRLNELGIYAGLGSSSLRYNATDGTLKPGFGGNIGVLWHHFFTKQFGISTGLEASLYNSTLSFDKLSVNYPVETPPDLTGKFTFKADYSDFSEKQTAIFIQLPLTLFYQNQLGNAVSFYLDAGLKFGLPLSATYLQETASLTTSGYSDYTLQVYEKMPNHGFDTYQSIEHDGKMEFGLAIVSTVNIGLKWKFNDRQNLYTGIYLDYGLNDVGKKNGSQQLIEYNYDSPTMSNHNGYLNSSVFDTSKGIHPFAFGVKIGMLFSR